MPAPVEQTTFRGCGFPQTGCYTLHGSLTSPYQAGFLAPESTHHLSFSCFRTMAFENHSSVTVTGSLRFLTWFPLLSVSINCQHLICFIWNYTGFRISHRLFPVNHKFACNQGCVFQPLIHLGLYIIWGCHDPITENFEQKSGVYNVKSTYVKK